MLIQRFFTVSPDALKVNFPVESLKITFCYVTSGDWRPIFKQYISNSVASKPMTRHFPLNSWPIRWTDSGKSKFRKFPNSWMAQWIITTEMHEIILFFSLHKITHVGLMKIMPQYKQINVMRLTYDVFCLIYINACTRTEFYLQLYTN